MTDWIMTRHWLEMAAFGSGVLVLALRAWSLRLAVDDYTFLVSQHAPLSPPRMLAALNVRQQQLKVLVAIVLVLASGAALTVEPDPPVTQPAVYSLAFILVSTLLSATVIVEYFGRKHLSIMTSDQNPWLEFTRGIQHQHNPPNKGAHP